MASEIENRRKDLDLLVKNFLVEKMSRDDYPARLLELLRVGPDLSPSIHHQLMKLRIKAMVWPRLSMTLKLLYVWEWPKMLEILQRLSETDEFSVGREVSMFIGRTCTPASIDEVCALILHPTGRTHPGAIVEGLGSAARRGVFSASDRERLFAAAQTLWTPAHHPGDDTFPYEFISLCPWKAHTMLMSPEYLNAEPVTVESGTTYLVLEQIANEGLTPDMNRILTVAKDISGLMDSQPVKSQLRDTASNTLPYALCLLEKYRYEPAVELLEKLATQNEPYMGDLARQVLEVIQSKRPREPENRYGAPADDLRELYKTLPREEMLLWLLPGHDPFVD